MLIWRQMNLMKMSLGCRIETLMSQGRWWCTILRSRPGIILRIYACRYSQRHKRLGIQSLSESQEFLALENHGFVKKSRRSLNKFIRLIPLSYQWTVIIIIEKNWTWWMTQRKHMLEEELNLLSILKSLLMIWTKRKSMDLVNSQASITPKKIQKKTK